MVKELDRSLMYSLRDQGTHLEYHQNLHRLPEVHSTFSRPKNFIYLDSFPTTPSGKTDRQSLKNKINN